MFKNHHNKKLEEELDKLRDTVIKNTVDIAVAEKNIANSLNMVESLTEKTEGIKTDIHNVSKKLEQIEDNDFLKLTKNISPKKLWLIGTIIGSVVFGGDLLSIGNFAINTGGDLLEKIDKLTE